MNMFGFVAIGGALWWLSSLHRNPDGAGFRDKSGRFHPIRSSEWYQPSLLDLPENGAPVSEPEPEPEPTRTAYDRRDRLRRGAERAATTKERATSVLAAGDARDRAMVESFGPLGAGFRDRTGAGVRARDAAHRRSMAAMKAADEAAYREATKDARADKIDAALTAGDAEGFQIGDTVRFVKRLTPTDKAWLAGRGHGSFLGTVEGQAQIVDRLLHTWRLKLTRTERSRTDGAAIAKWLYGDKPFEIAAKGSDGWGPKHRLLPLDTLTPEQRLHDQKTALETRLLRAVNRKVTDLDNSRDGTGTSALPTIEATIAKLTAEYEQLTGITPTYRLNGMRAIFGKGRPINPTGLKA